MSWCKGLTKKTDVRIEKRAHSLSLKVRQKQSDGKWNSPVPKGSKRSPEIRKKISVAKLGVPFSEEHKKAMSTCRIGIPQTLESNLKRSIALKGKPGNKHTLESKRKLHLANLGNKHSELTKRKMSYSHKQNWSSLTQEEKSAWLSNIRKSCQSSPNVPEQILLNLLDSNIPEYKYSGDGAIIIGGLIPDFVNTNGRKKVIEIFGDYWHRNDNPQDRINKFAEFGFGCLVIWEHELKQKTEQELIEVIKGFNER